MPAVKMQPRATKQTTNNRTKNKHQALWFTLPALCLALSASAMADPVNVLEDGKSNSNIVQYTVVNNTTIADPADLFGFVVNDPSNPCVGYFLSYMITPAAGGISQFDYANNSVLPGASLAGFDRTGAAESTFLAFGVPSSRAFFSTASVPEPGRLSVLAMMG